MKTVLAWSLLTCFASAQFSMTVAPNPVPAGGIVAVTVTNVGPGIGALTLTENLLLGVHGDRVLPRAVQVPGPNPALFPPGASVTTTLSLPLSGPGSSGSYVIFSQVSWTGLRLDVGTPSASFPALHVYPSLIRTPIAFSAQDPMTALTNVMFLETSGTAHTFVPGDYVALFTPGSTTPLAVSSLANQAVPALGRLEFPIPNQVPLVPPGAYTVEIGWFDPNGGFEVRRFGVHDLQQGGAQLHFPEGFTVPVGGSIEAWLGGYAFQVSPLGPVPVHLGFVAVGAAFGTTPFPGGIVGSLSLTDPLVQLSLMGGIPSLGGNVGMMTLQPIGSFFPQSYAMLNGISFAHPSPALSGLTVLAAGVMTDTSLTFWAASQPVEITLQ